MLITPPHIIYWMQDDYRTKTAAMLVTTGSQAED